MDPTFIALLNDLKAQGFTDNIFTWLAGLPADEWGSKVRQIQGWMNSLTPERRTALAGLGSFEAAQQFMGGQSPTAGSPQTPNSVITGGTTTPGASEQDKASAFASIRQMLNDFGLGSLADWAWKRYQDGFSLDQIMIEMYQRPEFKAVFPEYEVLAQKGRAYSVAELVNYRKQVVGMMKMYGIPEGFYDSVDDLSKLAANEVSLAEISRRVAEAADAAYSSSPLMRAEMQRLYGVNQGDMIAYFLDSTKAEPLIRQNWISAQIGAASRQTGYGVLTQQEAEGLAGLGVDYGAAAKGFGQLANSQELFGAINRGEQDIGREVQLGAAFGGDAASQQLVERRRGQRVAEFQAGGGFATNQQGVVGVS